MGRCLILNLFFLAICALTHASKFSKRRVIMQEKSSKNSKIYRPQFGIPTARQHP